jgi:hypothetical protein
MKQIKTNLVAIATKELSEKVKAELMSSTSGSLIDMLRGMKNDKVSEPNDNDGETGSTVTEHSALTR